MSRSWLYSLWVTLLFCLQVSQVFAEIQLQAPREVGIGAQVSITWQGEGDARDFITIVAPQAAEGTYADYQYARSASVKLIAPVEPGDYEIRYLAAASPYSTLARSALKVVSVSASLDAPAQVNAGADFSFTWQGPNNPQDFITLVAQGAPEGSYSHYQYTKRGSKLTLRAPDEAGQYELRYLMGASRKMLAQVPVAVVAVSASLSAPKQVAAGAVFAVHWEGPNNPQDFVALVVQGAPEKTYEHYQYTKRGSPVELRAPDKPGQYQVRYLTGASHATLARQDVAVTAVQASLSGPAQAMAGAKVRVEWQGPNNPQDFVTIVAVDAEAREYGRYVYTQKGNPIELPVPEVVGDYEFRYVTGGDHLILARHAISVQPASASLEAPDEVEAGTVVSVRWQGPNNENDYVLIVPADQEENHHGPYAYTRRGQDLRLDAPQTPGAYEVRYVTGAKQFTLARRALRVTPSRVPGILEVLDSQGRFTSNQTGPAMGVVLDASGSMLQKMEGRRRIEIAREALVQLTEEVLPANTQFALRVFGHKEKDSCRTDLEIPLGPLDKAKVSARIKSINAMNLARTPIARSLQLAAQDLASATGDKMILLVTDGEETCEGDPAAAIRAMRDAGLKVQVNIVGFAIDELMLRETFQAWARLGNGRYFDAQNAAQLASSLQASTRLSYQVLDGAHQVVAEGVVGGEALRLPAGEYRIRLAGQGQEGIADVRIEPDQRSVIDLTSLGGE